MKHERFTLLRLYRTSYSLFVVVGVVQSVPTHSNMIAKGAIVCSSLHCSHPLLSLEEATRDAFRLLVQAVATVALIITQVYDTWNGGIQV